MQRVLFFRAFSIVLTSGVLFAQNAAFGTSTKTSKKKISLKGKIGNIKVLVAGTGTTVKTTAFSSTTSAVTEGQSCSQADPQFVTMKFQRFLSIDCSTGMEEVQDCSQQYGCQGGTYQKMGGESCGSVQSFPADAQDMATYCGSSTSKLTTTSSGSIKE